jgi:hypothetical protein
MFKFLKPFGRSSVSQQSSAARLPSFRPGVEQLGAGVRTAARAAKRPSFQPGAERLEDRLVQSSSGAISAITDLRGQTAVFMVNAYDQRVYEFNPALTTRGWLALNNFGVGAFRQVSAGLDGAGRAVCYALNQNGHLWKLDGYGGYAYDAVDLGALAGGSSRSVPPGITSATPSARTGRSTSSTPTTGRTRLGCTRTRESCRSAQESINTARTSCTPSALHNTS